MKSFDIKTKIYFGDNALDRLADLPYKKALIITDPFVVKKRYAADDYISFKRRLY